jgi:hypothetical protein
METEPKCCCECKRTCEDGNNACDYIRCSKWRKWFRTQWAGIRKAADNIRKQNERVKKHGN